MELSKAGAKNARSVIKQFHACLNSSELVPDQYYRRNHLYYPLVSYVNHIMALFLSKNYRVIPVFLMRAHRALERVPAQPNGQAYAKVALNYLCQVAFFLAEFTDIGQESLYLIPKELLQVGAQEPPSWDGSKYDFGP